MICILWWYHGQECVVDFVQFYWLFVLLRSINYICERHNSLILALETWTLDHITVNCKNCACNYGNSLCASQQKVQHNIKSRFALINKFTIWFRFIKWEHTHTRERSLFSNLSSLVMFQWTITPGFIFTRHDSWKFQHFFALQHIVLKKNNSMKLKTQSTYWNIFKQALPIQRRICLVMISEICSKCFV